ncbi:MAG: hypothetical protein ACTHJH_13620 [Marmoricola sp.]
MTSVRALFATEDDARAVAARLLADGFTAVVGRAPFAGEDDDEDHAWSLDTEAPLVMVELLAEERDGWVEHEVAPSLRPPPLTLPDAPRRRHRPVRGDT